MLRSQRPNNRLGFFGGVGPRRPGGDDGKRDAGVPVGLDAVSTFVGGAGDGDGAEHGVGDQGLEGGAPFALLVGGPDGGGLVWESVLGEGAVVAGEETGVEGGDPADAFEIGVAIIGDDGGYEVGDFDFGRVPTRGPGAFRDHLCGICGTGEGGPGEDGAFGDLSADPQHLVEDGGGVDGDPGVEGGEPEVEVVDVQYVALVGNLAVS